jgi:serine/threonine protein kinase
MPNYEWDTAEHRHEWSIAAQFFHEYSAQVKRVNTTPYDSDNKLLAHTYVKASDDVIYRLGNIIGNGSCGKVVRAWDEDGNAYAMKVSGASNREENKTATDLGLLASPEFGCPAGTKELEPYQSEDGTEFYAPLRYLGKSLSAYLAENKDLTLKQRCDLAAKIFIATHQFLRGEASCSGKEYTHDDIKPENIVIDANGNVHFIDVGLVSNNRNAARSTEQGSPAHMAPKSIPGISREQASRLATMRCALMGHDFPSVDGKDLGRELVHASFVFQDIVPEIKHYESLAKKSSLGKGYNEIPFIVADLVAAIELTAFVDEKIQPLLATTCKTAGGAFMSAEQFQATFPKSDLDLAVKLMLLKPGSYLNDVMFDENWSELQKQSIVNLNLANCQEGAVWQRILGNDLSLQIAIAALGKFGQEYLTLSNMRLIAESENPILQMVEIILPEGLSPQARLNCCDAILHDKKLSLIKKAIFLLSYLGITNIQTWQKVAGNNISVQQSLIMLGKFDPDLISETTVNQLSSAKAPIDKAIEMLTKAINILPTAPKGKPYRQLLNDPDSSPLRKAIIVLALLKLHPHAPAWTAVVEDNTQLHHAIAALNDRTADEVDNITRKLIHDPTAQDIIYELAKCHPKEINLKMVKALVAENSWLKRSFLLLNTFSAVFSVKDNILLLCSGNYSAIAARTLVEFATFDHSYYQNLGAFSRPPAFAEMVWQLNIADNSIWSAILDMTDTLSMIPADKDVLMRRMTRKQFIHLGLALELEKKPTSPGKPIQYSQHYASKVHYQLFPDDENSLYAKDAQTEFMQAITAMSHNKTVPALINDNQYFTAAAKLLKIDVATLAQDLAERHAGTLNETVLPKFRIKTYKALKQEAIVNREFVSQDGLIKAVKIRFSFGSSSSRTSDASSRSSGGAPSVTPPRDSGTSSATSPRSSSGTG